MRLTDPQKYATAMTYSPKWHGLSFCLDDGKDNSHVSLWVPSLYGIHSIILMKIYKSRERR